MRGFHRGPLLPMLVCGIVFLMLPPTSFGQQPQGQRQPRPRRLYFGAPPTIPHDAGPDFNDCLVCHGVNDSGAPLTPHPTRLRCRQCHVGADEKSGQFRGNSFSGLTIPGPTPRLTPDGPPEMAHPVLLHEDCLACHAPGARTDVISTPHAHCQQCHVPVQAASQTSPTK
jgi:nitrate reductase cytochrome c-type subunit